MDFIPLQNNSFCNCTIPCIEVVILLVAMRHVAGEETSEF